MKIFDFLDILTLITISCMTIALVDWFLRRRKSRDERGKGKRNILVEFAFSYFPVLLLVVIIRSVVFQPYKVPTGSLEPTVIPGDLIFVTQYNYGVTLPLLNRKLIDVSSPARGQIALFRWPVNPSVTFVKRVVGVPGDRISYLNKVFYINGQQMKQTYVGPFREVLGSGAMVKRYIENLDGVKHYILRNPTVPAVDFKDLIVPKGFYMMIGDNRDDSDDSRDWGFVPVNYFLGKAQFVWFNFSLTPFHIGWDRIGTKLFGSITPMSKSHHES